MILESIITCPHCHFKQKEVMPTNSCLYFYECTNCNKTLKPNQGDCCVFCSYGNIKCPPIQKGSNHTNLWLMKKYFLSIIASIVPVSLGIFGLTICCLPAAAGFVGVLGIVAIFSYKYSAYLLIGGIVLVILSILLIFRKRKCCRKRK